MSKKSRRRWMRRQKGNEARHARQVLGVCKCGSTSFVDRVQTFKDGTLHVRRDCAKCGKYLAYLPEAELLMPPEQYPPVGPRRRSRR